MSDTLPLDSELLEILACPESHQAVQVAPADVLSRLNERIAAGDVKDRGGRAVEDGLQAGLLREDRKILYPVRDGIPIMLIEESIEV